MVPILLISLLSSLCVVSESVCWIDVLCSQETGFCFHGANRSVAIASVPEPYLEREGCVMCGQISSSKQIDCRECTHVTGGKALLFDYIGMQCGLQDISMQVFATSLEVLPDVTTNQHYIIPANNADYYGFVNITRPQFGAILSNDLYIELAYKDLSPKKLQRQREIQYDFGVVGIINGVYPGSMKHLASSNIEPGSWFYTVTPLSTDLQGVVEKGFPTQGYIEFVLEEADIVRNRRFFDHQDTNQSPYAVGTAIVSHKATASMAGVKFGKYVDVDGAVPTSQPPDEKVNVCIWSSDNMDGQKRIWLQQIEHLDPARFRFTWMLTFKDGRTLTEEKEKYEAHPNSLNSMYSAVSRLLERNRNGVMIDSPFNGVALDIEALHADPGDGRQPAAETWAHDEINLYRYAHESLVRANYSIDHMQPTWCQELYVLLQDALPPHRCSVLVYGNERGFSPDVLVTDAARILGIPTAGELLNLFVDQEVVPTVLVAPSTYAVEHETIQAVLNIPNIDEQRHPLAVQRPFAVVIPPSVDFNAFDPARFAENRAQNPIVFQHPACRAVGYKYAASDGPSAPCTVIAFVARLAPEKNIGLFLQAAYHILQDNPLARFTIVGDGALRQSLETLADRLQIRWAVHFAGWVSGPALPQLLAGVDIVINPSLRAWSETFCIANIEVMSMRVPLITFAVGGIGEYVQNPVLSQHSARNGSDASSAAYANHYHDSLGDFSISDNAVVVHRANPVAVARAASHLIRHSELRRALGQRSRETVIAHFGVQRQMQQYADLYSYLHTL